MRHWVSCRFTCSPSHLIHQFEGSISADIVSCVGTAKDEADAIDESNIIDERTRGVVKEGGYAEPGDEEGLGGPDDGRSRVAGGPN